MEEKELEKKAKEIRRGIIEQVYKAQSGHPGGSLSIADVMTVLYFEELNVDINNPLWESRDRVILSKGHCCPALYSCLANKGFFDVSELGNFRKIESKLQGHPDMKRCPGIDISTGSLGQGLSCGVGMALAAKRDKRDYRVFVVIGDGELDEGQIWEAVMAAYAWKLDNLVVIIDNNGLQLDGTTDQIIPHLDLTKKFEVFGYETYEINGNSMKEILETLEKIRASTSAVPKCINAHTIKGKGVSFMENQASWHGSAPNDEQYAAAMEELEKAGEAICQM